MHELRKRLNNSRNGSILSSVYLAEVKAVAFAVISSGYCSQALLYTHSDQRYIRRYGIHEHYLYPCWVRVDLYTAGDETRLQIFGSARPLLYAYHGCTPRGVSILRIPLVIGCLYVVYPYISSVRIISAPLFRTDVREIAHGLIVRTIRYIHISGWESVGVTCI